MGYGIITKGYRILCLQIEKVILSRDVKVDEATTWDWEHQKNMISDHPFTIQPQSEADESVDDFPVRGTSLEDIHLRCNMAILEPTSYTEA